MHLYLNSSGHGYLKPVSQSWLQNPKPVLMYGHVMMCLRFPYKEVESCGGYVTPLITEQG